MSDQLLGEIVRIASQLSVTPSATEDDVVAFFQELLQLSRQQSIRDEFAERNLTSKVASYLSRRGSSSNDEQEEILLLRLLSNLCVNCPNNQLQIASNELVSDFLIPQLLSGVRSIEFLTFAVQLLANAITLNERTQSILWPKLFSSVFSAVLSKIEHRKLIAKSTSLLYNIVRTNEEYQRELLETEAGVRIIGSLLHLTMVDKKAADDEAFDWIYFLIRLCFSSHRLGDIYRELGRLIERPPQSKRVLLAEQSTLVKMLDAIVEKMYNQSEEKANDELPIKTCVFFAEELMRLYQLKDTDHNYADIDENILLILQFLGTVTSFDIPTLRDELQRTGLIGVIIGMLERYYLQDKESMKNFSISPLSIDEYSCRRFVVQVVANMSFRNRVVQDEVRACRGLFLLLNHCNLDDKNPYIREWAILALRNLLEDNEENQNEIKALKVQQVVPTPEISQLGLSFEVVNGKIRVKQQQPPQQ